MSGKKGVLEGYLGKSEIAQSGKSTIYLVTQYKMITKIIKAELIFYAGC